MTIIDYGDFVLRINPTDSVVVSVRRAWWAPWRARVEITIGGATARSPLSSVEETLKAAEAITRSLA